jgi:hypothetical protein
LSAVPREVFPFSTIRSRNLASTLHLRLAATGKKKSNELPEAHPSPELLRPTKTNGPGVNAQEPLQFTDIPCSHGEGLWQWHLHSQTILIIEVHNTNSYLAMVQVVGDSGCGGFRSLSIQVVKHSGGSVFRLY